MTETFRLCRLFMNDTSLVPILILQNLRCIFAKIIHLKEKLSYSRLCRFYLILSTDYI